MAKEEEKKTAAKKAPAKKAAASKTTASKKTEAKAAPAKKAPAKKTAAKKAPSGKTITVTQTGSPISREARQRQTLIGLGLNKLNRTNTLEDTPAVRGMIKKVNHLIKVEEAA